MTAGAFAGLLYNDAASVLSAQVVIVAIICAMHAIGTWHERRRVRKARRSDIA
jgi:hypothetical protein